MTLHLPTLVFSDYGTATPAQFFEILEKQTPNQNITEIFSSYNSQAGFPLIHATREGNTVTLSQQRFLITSKDHEDKSRWNLRITWAEKAGDYEAPGRRLKYFPATEDTIQITLANDTEFYVLNLKSFDYYRINYDEDNWNKIGKTLKENHLSIHVLNRAQIVDDLFQLARVGYLTYDFMLDIIFEYLKKEVSYVPWTSALNGLSYLQQRIPNLNYKKEFEVNDFRQPLPTSDLEHFYLITAYHLRTQH